MNLDPNALADIIERMVKKATDGVVNRTYKRGVIASVAGQVVSVNIEGNAVATSGVICLSHYVPAVGHKVLIASIGDTGANLVVIGRIP